jgi:hypothetical protein
LRDDMHLECLHPPAAPGSAPTASALRLECRTRDASAASLAIWSIYCFFGSGMLVMLASRRGLQPSLAAGAAVVAAVTLALGCAFLVVMTVRRRRQRGFLVELRPGSARSRVVDADALRELRTACGPGSWCVSESGFTAGGLAVARELGVRCFAMRRSKIEEVG